MFIPPGPQQVWSNGSPDRRPLPALHTRASSINCTTTRGWHTRVLQLRCDIGSSPSAPLFRGQRHVASAPRQVVDRSLIPSIFTVDAPPRTGSGPRTPFLSHSCAMRPLRKDMINDIGRADRLTCLVCFSSYMWRYLAVDRMGKRSRYGRSENAKGAPAHPRRSPLSSTVLDYSVT